MKTLIASLILFIASAASAQTILTCDDFYPEAESPENTTAIASLVFRSDGSLAGLHCFLAEGSPSETCKIADGACCTCNVARGFTPECTVIVEHTPEQTKGRCIQTYPACYYGNTCDSTTGAFLSEETAAVTRHSKVKRHRRKQ